MLAAAAMFSVQLSGAFAVGLIDEVGTHGPAWLLVTALAFTIPIDAIAFVPIGLPQALPHISAPIIATAFGLALLMPVIPLVLEIVALRGMGPATFGTLMALEPAMGVVIGAIVLAQIPLPIQILGIILVVAAGIGSERFAARDVSPETLWPETD